MKTTILVLYFVLISVNVIKKSETTIRESTLEKCMDDLGCFRWEGDFYHFINMTINLLPFDRDRLNVKYNIYTTKNPLNHYLLHAVNVRNFDFRAAHINPMYDTKIIIHGYLDNQIFFHWMKKMKDEFLKNGDYNVIIVDWSGGNLPPYLQAAANTRVVGAEVALLINTMSENIGLNPLSVQIIGHSLGGQIAGYAGERIRNLGRITSLDPARPLFQGTPPSVRIDPTDAQYVEVIHTDSVLQLLKLSALGMSQLAGHVDFFPNNGFQQPGCLLEWTNKFVSDGLFEGTRSLLLCNHQRAVDYLMESINSKCQMVGYTCKDWQSFLDGECFSCGDNGESCSILGAPSNGLPNTIDRKYYFKTHDTEPFCLFHYNVQVKLLNKSVPKQNGYFILILEGSGTTKTYNLGTPSRNLHHGVSHSFLLTTPQDLGFINRVLLRWISTSVNIFFMIDSPRIYIESVTIKPMSIIDPRDRSAELRRYCYRETKAVESGSRIVMGEC